MPEALHFEDGTPIYCEYTDNGPDKSLIWACGKPATYDDYNNDTWYCDEHKPIADPDYSRDHVS